jgi:hypothetical protein
MHHTFLRKGQQCHHAARPAATPLAAPKVITRSAVRSVFSSNTTSPRTTTSAFARASQGAVDILGDGPAHATFHLGWPYPPPARSAHSPAPNAYWSSVRSSRASVRLRPYHWGTEGQPGDVLLHIHRWRQVHRQRRHRRRKGISGSGKVVLSIVGILGRMKSGACSMNRKPVAWQQTYRGTARIKL